jgi:uncharacterized membrane protein YhaH (DUF805 family)
MNLLFGFSGRIGRGQWWLAQLVVMPVIIAITIGVIAAFASGDTSGGSAFDKARPSILLIIGAVFVLLVWINAASTVKRFHDRGKSGWWFLIVFVPYIGAVWQIVECGFLSGTPGTNSYGSPPGSGSLNYADLEAEVAGYATSEQRQAPVAKPMLATPPQTMQLRQSSPSRFGRRGV